MRSVHAKVSKNGAPHASAGRVVSLCPAACDAVQAGGSIDVGFGCDPIVLL